MSDNANVGWKRDYKVVKVGDEKTPCIVIDDYSENIDSLNHDAKKVTFESVVDKNYPGIRGALPETYTKEAVEYLRDIIVTVYGVPDDYNLSDYSGYYSLVTKTGAELSLGQKMPHFDTAEPYYFAVLQYLNDGSHGGTGFFKHKPSGIERVFFDCVDLFLKRAKQYIAGNGSPKGGYCFGDDHFELVDKVTHVKNRLIVYPGNLLHSALIDDSLDVSSDLDFGRLTANIFMGFDKC